MPADVVAEEDPALVAVVKSEPTLELLAHLAVAELYAHSVVAPVLPKTYKRKLTTDPAVVESMSRQSGRILTIGSATAHT